MSRSARPTAHLVETIERRRQGDRAKTLPSDAVRPPTGRGTILLPHCTSLSASTVGFRRIAAGLAKRGFDTAPTQLLTLEETAHGYHLFDIDLLARRIVEAAGGLGDKPIGLFGLNVDAAAILAAAAKNECPAHALVLCNARPDLVSDVLSLVRVPTLCIVEDDELTLALNRKALAELGSHGELAILPAGESFGSSAAAGRVVQLAADWFAAYLPQ